MKKNYPKVLFGVLFCILLAHSFSAQSKTVLTFTVFTGDFDRFNSPVSVSLVGTGLQISNVDYQLVEIEKNQETPVHFQMDRNQIWWILSGETPAGIKRLFELRKTNNSTTDGPQH